MHMFLSMFCNHYSIQDRGQVIATTLIMTRFYQSLLTLSKDGALFTLKLLDRMDETRGVACVGLEGYLCRHCFSLFNDGQKTREHTSRQHIGPAICNMCGSEKEDVMQLSEHKKQCGFPCHVNGCVVKHKTSLSAEIHYKKYLKNIKKLYSDNICLNSHFLSMKYNFVSY